MRPALIPYAGRPKQSVPPIAVKKHKPRIEGRPEPLQASLGLFGQSEVLRLFRAGFDTVDIAKQLQCTPAAAANALARARDRLMGEGP